MPNPIPPRRRAPREPRVDSLLFKMAREMSRLRDSTITRCTYCDERIVWAHRPNPDTGDPTSAWHPPVEFVEFAMTIVNDAVLTVPVYRKHVCVPAKIRANDIRKAAEQAARRERQDSAAERVAHGGPNRYDQLKVAHRKLLDAAVTGADCPRCGVSKPDPCENLTERRRGNQVPNVNPHPQRLRAFLAEHPEQALADIPPPGAEQMQDQTSTDDGSGAQ